MVPLAIHEALIKPTNRQKSKPNKTSAIVFVILSKRESQEIFSASIA